VQETALADPALLVDQNAVHDRYLPRRPAEAEGGDAKPDPDGIGKRDAVIVGSSHLFQPFFAECGQLWVSSVALRRHLKKAS
jgi:hypothetical protein